MKTVAIPQMRRVVSRRRAAFYLACAVSLAWACWIAAHHISIDPLPELVVSASDMNDIKGLHLHTHGSSRFEIVFEKRSDLIVQWQGSGPTAVNWKREGDTLRLVVSQQVSRLVVLAPSTVSNLHGSGFMAVEARSATPMDNLSVNLSAGHISGNVHNLRVTLRQPGCSEGIYSARHSASSVKINTIGTTDLHVVAASGQLRLGAMAQAQTIDVRATPYVGLEVQNITTLQRLRFTPLDLDEAHALQKAANAC